MARKKPHDPGQLARLQAEKAERNAEIVRLQQMGATITLDPGGRIVSARRSNVFNLLLVRGTITSNHYEAAYRLAERWAAWKGLDGKPEGMAEFVDGGACCPEIVTDRMLRAGKDIAAVLILLGDHRRLMEAFMVATVEEDRPMAWRGVVVKATGETVRDRQTTRTVEALEALRQIVEGTIQHRVAA